jgi:glycogen phosphorylase
MSPHATITFAKATELAREIKSIAYNLWWTWNADARDLFRELSPQTYFRYNHNIIAMFDEISDQELAARLLDPLLMGRAKHVADQFKDYMSEKNTWASKHAKDLISKGPVAYFSAEFGLHESLPIYSGGLGILAGDHAKSASDLGLPFIGVSLYYRQGYFEQRIGPDGWQQEEYPLTDPTKLPLELVTDESGNPIVAQVKIGHSDVYFHAWRINIGRVSIILLDTNREENELHYREMTSQVYGGDISTRIAQEIVLGIGGVRMLRGMGITPAVYHMNEGHSAFLTLELLRELVREKGKSTAQAIRWVREHTVFTTHTPVPAGHDRFSEDLIRFTLQKFCTECWNDASEIMHFGRVNPHDPEEPFCMTVLGIKMSRATNGVSELHARVSREMWKDLYRMKTVDKIPIGHITNGVHHPGWTSSRAYRFWQNTISSDWMQHLDDPGFWKRIEDPGFITDEEIWALRYVLKRELIEFVRTRMRQQSVRQGINPGTTFDKILSTDALTIGFARRFATYKRATLFFSDINRAKRILLDPERPVQIVFAGKAHPRDDAGKRLIQQLVNYSRDPELHGRVVFVENYDINAGRLFVSGSDVWLNNPRRPLEASGTSGQKTAIHGGLNISIMDGWWREAYNGKNGWAIGEDNHPDSIAEQDHRDAMNLYDVLENHVIPEFYDREGNGLPRRWISRIRHTMATLIPVYNTDRMVEEYVNKYYMPKKANNRKSNSTK